MQKIEYLVPFFFKKGETIHGVDIIQGGNLIKEIRYLELWSILIKDQVVNYSDPVKPQFQKWETHWGFSGIFVKAQAQNDLYRLMIT